MKILITFFAVLALTTPAFSQMEMPLLVPVTQSNLITSVTVNDISVPSLANPGAPYVISATFSKRKNYSTPEGAEVSVSANGRVNYSFSIQIPPEVLAAKVASFSTSPPPAAVQAWLQSVGRDPAGADAALVLLGQEAASPAIAAMQTSE